jgi:hypothetical protein
VTGERPTGRGAGLRLLAAAIALAAGVAAVVVAILLVRSVLGS